jgi:hypothetical protein
MTNAASDKTCAYVWRSLDNGAAWRTVVVPQTNGGLDVGRAGG